MSVKQNPYSTQCSRRCSTNTFLCRCNRKYQNVWAEVSLSDIIFTLVVSATPQQYVTQIDNLPPLPLHPLLIELITIFNRIHPVKSNEATFYSGWISGRKYTFINTRRYGPLRVPTFSSCGALQPRQRLLFLTFEQNIMVFWPVFVFFAIVGVQ